MVDALEQDRQPRRPLARRGGRPARLGDSGALQRLDGAELELGHGAGRRLLLAVCAAVHAPASTPAPAAAAVSALIPARILHHHNSLRMCGGKSG